MEEIIKACEELDFSGLLPQIGNFVLTIDKKETELGYALFHYENELGWRWEALYDKEVEDYTVHVVMPLFQYTDINFVDETLEPYWKKLQERYERELTNLLIEPSNNFTYAYKQKEIPQWDFSKVLPNELEGYILDINPKTGVRMINGSYIIAEYRKMDDPSGLILFYNVLRDEFFAELRCHNYPEIDHKLDAKTISELEKNLQTHLTEILVDLNQRL